LNLNFKRRLVMDKKTFDIIEKHYELETELFFEIEKKGIELDNLVELFDKLADFREQTLKIGKYLDKEKYVNRDTYIATDLEKLPKYTKLNVIYEYDNGMALCITTSEMIHLVPKVLLVDE